MIITQQTVADRIAARLRHDITQAHCDRAHYFFR